MALGKAAKELGEELLSPKRGPRTEFKDITKAPEGSTLEQAVKNFEEDKTEAFAQTRREDITLDEKANYADQAKQTAKVEAKQADLAILEEKKTQRNPFPDRETFLKEERDIASIGSRQEELVKLQEKQRDLYLKANNLKKERDATSIMQQQKQEGVSFFDTLLNTVASTPGTGRKFSNIESRTDAIYNRVNAGMFELKESLRTKWLGLSQDTEMANDIIRYLKDGQVKNTKNLAQVKQISEQWVKASEQIKNLRNKAGARIGKLEDWVMPQSHDKLKIRKAGFDNWSKSIMPKLDRVRIEKEQGTSLENILKSAYNNIVSPRVETKGGGTGSNLAKQGEELRVLHFKDGEGMITYKDEFGNPDLFSTMDSHIRQQSNEVAAMQILGSNPEATYNKLKELARAEGMGSTAETHLDQAFRLSTGQVDGDDIVSQLDGWMATIGGTHRALQVSSKLGSAMISSLADISSIVLGSGYRGLSSVNILGKGLHTLLQEATSIGKVADNVRIANRIGVVSEFASASLANSRYAEVGAGKMQRAAETVIRASGLGSYTNSMRTSVGLELAGNFAENFSKKLDDTPFSGLLKEYGITSKEWDTIRGTEPFKAKGAEFLDTAKVYEADEQLGYKLGEMISNEMDAFVIMPTNRTRIWTTWGERKGTIKGELARNMMLFKSFPIASTLMHLKRVGKIDTVGGKVAYGGSLIAVNTVMGGITLWAYDVATGKTPRSIDRPAFVPEALSKSGGLGIFGDFFIGLGDTKYGKSFGDTLMGVPVSTMNDIVDTVQDILVKDQSTEKTVGNIYNRAKSYIPGQNLWYTRTAIENTVGEFFGELLDPDYQQRVRRRQKAMRLRDQKDIFN